MYTSNSIVEKEIMHISFSNHLVWQAKMIKPNAEETLKMKKQIQVMTARYGNYFYNSFLLFS